VSGEHSIQCNKTPRMGGRRSPFSRCSFHTKDPRDLVLGRLLPSCAQSFSFSRARACLVSDVGRKYERTTRGFPRLAPRAQGSKNLPQTCNSCRKNRRVSMTACMSAARVFAKKEGGRDWRDMQTSQKKGRVGAWRGVGCARFCLPSCACMCLSVFVFQSGG